MSTAPDTVIATTPKSPAHALASVPEHAPVSPSSYVPSLPASAHLEFVRPVIDSHLRCVMDACVTLQGENPSEDVAKWLTAKTVEITQTINVARDQAHLTNARRLAERVVHKFQKWAPVRFGNVAQCQRCFYTGASPVDSATNPITFDPVFEAQLREVAGKDFDAIVAGLHIGSACAYRFSGFIKVPSVYAPESDHDDEDDEDDEDHDDEDHDDQEDGEGDE